MESVGALTSFSVFPSTPHVNLPPPPFYAPHAHLSPLPPPPPPLAGGLLSERYLGKAEPNSRAELNTASLSKYKNMIDSWGRWTLFQDLLVALETIAKRHECSVASVATRYVLDRPAVGGVIVGCRFGVAGAGQYISDSLRSCSPELKLTAEDHAAIEAVSQRSTDLMALIGDCGDEYRRWWWGADRLDLTAQRRRGKENSRKITSQGIKSFKTYCLKVQIFYIFPKSFWFSLSWFITSIHFSCFIIFICFLCIFFPLFFVNNLCKANPKFLRMLNNWKFFICIFPCMHNVNAFKSL